MTDSISRIGLGTAQFGLDYGISNLRGKVAESNVSDILDHAWKTGVKILDTAKLYGDSEAVLGRLMAPKHQFKIITKTPTINRETITKEDARNFRAALEDSLRLMNQTSIYCLMVHHGHNLLRPGSQHLIRILEDVKAEKLIEQIGVSVYSGDEIDAILENFAPDIVQLPFNAADLRLKESDHLSKLKNIGVEIHARSLFLQGLLLQEPENLPDYFDPIKSSLKQFGATAGEHGLSRLEACLASALAQPELDTLIVGTTCLSEFEEILRAVQNVDSNCITDTPKVVMDHNFIDPTHWPQ